MSSYNDSIDESGFPQLSPEHSCCTLIWLVFQTQILKKGAGLLQGSRNSVIRASTAKVGDLDFDWLPMHFSSVCFYPDLPPVAYHQFLTPVVVNQYSYMRRLVVTSTESSLYQY